MRAGVLSVDAPSSPGWELIEDAHYPDASCSAMVGRRVGASGSSIVLAVQLPKAPVSLQEAAESAAQWALDSMFDEAEVYTSSNESLRMNGNEIHRADFEIAEPTGTVSQITAVSADYAEHGRSVILTVCDLGDPDNCPEVEDVLQSLRWER